ncbi:MAG: class I SAM-dependent methyltransferase [Gemmataceae bacterium]
MNLAYWLRHPKLVLARIRYWRWERANPDKPWLCPGTIAFCEKHLNKNMVALEFGSGRSTRWFAKLVGHITSIEHHEAWYTTVQEQLREAGQTNVDYRLIPLDHPEADAEQPIYNPVPKYVAEADRFADGSLHFGLVDGHYRTHCVRHLVPKIAPGGYLLVDDLALWSCVADVPVPPTWKIVDDSTNGLKQTLIWQAPLAGG